MERLSDAFHSWLAYYNSKALEYFNSRTRKVEENLHVNFLENKPNVAGSGPEWLFDIDILTNSMNYQPVSGGNRTNGNAGLEINYDAGQVGKENVPDPEYIRLPLLHTNPNVSSNLRRTEIDFKILGFIYGIANDMNKWELQRLTLKQLGNQHMSLVEAMQEELRPVQNYVMFGHWWDLPHGNKGHRQEEKIDVRSAFLYGTIEKEGSSMHLSRKETLSTYLMENGFRRGTIDKTLFIKKIKNDILLVQVEQRKDGIFLSQDKYVYDILKKFGFSNVKTTSTLMEIHKPLLQDTAGTDVDISGSTKDLICTAVKRALRNLKRATDFHVDNESAILWRKNPCLSFKTKHIEIRACREPRDASRDSYEKKLIEMVKIHTDYNVRQTLLTKAIDVSRYVPGAKLSYWGW
ncbi:hypothetical protein Tco_0396057 [Tanacetum coccineum]